MLGSDQVSLRNFVYRLRHIYVNQKSHFDFTRRYLAGDVTGTVSGTFSAYFVSFFTHSAAINSVLSWIGDIAAGSIVFWYLHFKENSGRYRNNGSISLRNIIDDGKRYYLVAVPAGIAYAVYRPGIQFLLMINGQPAVQAALLAKGFAALIDLLILNFFGRRTAFIRDT